MKFKPFKMFAAVAAVGAFLVLAPAGSAHASATLAPSSEPSVVMDSADLFTGTQEQALMEHFADLYASRDIVTVVETITELPFNEDIEEFSLARANDLGVGDAGKDNGVYILIAVDDREARLELGAGVQERVSDYQAEDIMDSIMVEAFAEEDWFGGVRDGAEAVAVIYSPTDAEVVAAAEAERQRQEQIDAFGAGITTFFQWTLGFILVGVLIYVIYRMVRKVREDARRVRNRVTHNLGQDTLDRIYTGASSDEFVQARGTQARLDVAVRAYKKVLAALPEKQRKWFGEDFQTQTVDRVQMTALKNALADRVGRKMDFVPMQDMFLAGEHLLNAGKSIVEVAEEIRPVMQERNKKRAAVDKKRREEQARQEKIRQEEQARAEAERKRLAEEFWDTLDESQKHRLKTTRARQDRERLVRQYGGDMNMVPFWVTMGVIFATQHSSSSSSSSYASSSSSSSYDSYSSFSGGGFSGGGASGSW